MSDEVKLMIGVAKDASVLCNSPTVQHRRITTCLSLAQMWDGHLAVQVNRRVLLFSRSLERCNIQDCVLSCPLDIPLF